MQGVGAAAVAAYYQHHSESKRESFHHFCIIAEFMIDFKNRSANETGMCLWDIGAYEAGCDDCYRERMKNSSGVLIRF